MIKDFLHPIYFLLFSSISSQAQTLEWFAQLKSPFNATLDAIEVQPNQTLWVGGSFEEQFDAQGFSLATFGGTDILVGQTDAQGNLLQLVSGGSILNDQLVDIEQTVNNQLITTGIFWLEAQFDTLTLTSNGSAQGVFLVSYNENLKVQWGKSISASQAITVETLETDTDGNIWLIGSFSGSLLLQDSLLFSSSKEVFMLLCFDATGRMITGFQGNESVKNIGKSVVSMTDGDIIFTGNFEGNFIWGKDTIVTNTTDSDIFIAAMAQDGTPIWLQKAGGVFRDEVENMILAAGDLFLTGNFIGVLAIEEGIPIQSVGFNDNIFLLRYRADGSPVWAKSIGDVELEHVNALATDGNQLVLGGYFLDKLALNQDTLIGSVGQFNGFLLQTDLNGNPTWAKSFVTTSTLLVSDIAIGTSKEIIASGYFQGDWEELSIQSFAFNPFLIATSFISSSISTTKSIPIEITYSAAERKININTDLLDYQIKITDSQGRILSAHPSSKSIDVTNLPAGVYVVISFYKNQRFSILLTVY